MLWTAQCPYHHVRSHQNSQGLVSSVKNEPLVLWQLEASAYQITNDNVRIMKSLMMLVMKEVVEWYNIHSLKIFVGLSECVSKDIKTLMMTARHWSAMLLYGNIPTTHLVVLILPPSLGMGPPA